MKNNGFTLIELIVVCVIAAILATIVIGAVRRGNSTPYIGSLLLPTHVLSTSTPTNTPSFETHKGTHRMEIRIDGVTILDTVLK